MNCRFDLEYVLSVLLIARREWKQNILFTGIRIDSHILRLAQRKETVVGTIVRLVPSLLPCELVVDVRVNLKHILTEHLHGPSIEYLLLEGWEQICRRL